MILRVHHHLPGRTRLRLDPWPDAETFGHIQHTLSRVGCMISAANPLTGSLLVIHPNVMTASELREHVASGLEGGRRPVSRSQATTNLLNTDLDRIALAEAGKVVSQMETSTSGLSDRQVQERLSTYGYNAVPMPSGRSRAEMVAGQFTTFPVALLFGSAVLSIATGGLVDAAVTLGVVFANAGIGFTSENAAERLIRRLSRPVEHEASVLRGGAPIIVTSRELVPGDVISLHPGSFIPADARVLDADNLSVDESSLTGESLPVHKAPGALTETPASVAERTNILHGGTVVTGGSGRAIVVGTGSRTEMARTQAMIGLARPPRPDIEDELARLGSRLSLACLGASGALFAIGLLRGEPLFSIAKSAIALAVAAIPEGLPAVATSTLALGARSMERENAYVRALPAIEALGTVDTICLDKTGTLTENRMRVVAACVNGRSLDLSPGKEWTAQNMADLQPLAEAVTLCNEASLTDGSGSATELALLHFAQLAGAEPDRLQGVHPILAMRSRNHHRRWMATEHHDGDSPFLTLKGAPDELLAMASQELANGTSAPLDEARRREILSANDRFAARGLRVLGVARSQEKLASGDPAGLTWLGLVALADPIRAEAREAIATFHRAGIRTIMLTGDQSATALAVAEELTLSRTGIIPVLETSRLTGLDDRQVGEMALKTSVFARVSPSDKLRIVRGLQAVGKRVAMIGDGINDGPALRAAAVGVAMGAGGTDVAREVADIVIADDDLRALARAIARGRATDDNVRNAIRYFLSTNLAEVSLMLGESLHGRGELETPMELFWLNLVTDVLPGLGLTLAEPRGDVMTRPPRSVAGALFAKDEIRSMVLDGGGIAAASLAAHFLMQSRAGLGPRARGTTFLTMGLAQYAHAWALRDRSHASQTARKISERRLAGALAASGVLLALPFAFPALGRLLGIARPTAGDIALSGALAGTSFLFGEGRRLAIRGTAAKAGTSPESQHDQTASAPDQPRGHVQAG